MRRPSTAGACLGGSTLAAPQSVDAANDDGFPEPRRGVRLRGLSPS